MYIEMSHELGECDRSDAAYASMLIFGGGGNRFITPKPVHSTVVIALLCTLYFTLRQSWTIPWTVPRKPLQTPQ